MGLGEGFEFKRQAIIYFVILSTLPYHSSFYIAPSSGEKKKKTLRDFKPVLTNMVATNMQLMSICTIACPN